MRTGALLMLVAVAACDDAKSSKSSKAAKIPPPSAQALSKFKADRAAACIEFSDRATPKLREDRLPAFDALLEDCLSKGTVTKENYGCLLSATSANGVGECFAGKGPVLDGGEALEADKKVACKAYARHVLELMAMDLRRVTTDSCMAPQMKEAQYDCVMAAKTDAEFKKCW